MKWVKISIGFIIAIMTLPLLIITIDDLTTGESIEINVNDYEYHDINDISNTYDNNDYFSYRFRDTVNSVAFNRLKSNINDYHITIPTNDLTWKSSGWTSTSLTPAEVSAIHFYFGTEIGALPLYNFDSYITEYDFSSFNLSLLQNGFTIDLEDINQYLIDNEGTNLSELDYFSINLSTYPIDNSDFSIVLENPGIFNFDMISTTPATLSGTIATLILLIPLIFTAGLVWYFYKKSYN